MGRLKILKKDKQVIDSACKAAGVEPPISCSLSC